MKLTAQVGGEDGILTAEFESVDKSVEFTAERYVGNEVVLLRFAGREDVEALRDLLDMALCHWPAPEGVGA